MKTQKFTHGKRATHFQHSQMQKARISALANTSVTLTDLSWVKVRGIGLYALWSKQHIPSDVIPAHPDIWSMQTQIDLWPVTQLQWLPPASTPSAGASWIAVDEIEGILDTLRKHLAAISGSGNSKGARAQPAYLIFHIDEMETRIPATARKNIRRLHRSWHEAKDGEQAAQQGALEEVVDALQLYLNIANVDQQTGWGPSRFSHYDREEGQRGWVVLSPSLAIVAKMSAQQVNNLIALLQPRDTDNSGKGKGIFPQRYEVVYERVMQWNAAHDIFETVVQLENIVESGQKSTDGQLWLNFALAAIGVLLAFFAGPKLNLREIIALGLLCGASVMYALYARNGKPIYQRLGWLLFAASIILAITLLFWHY